MKQQPWNREASCETATLANGFEYTQNMPDHDVRDLGKKGLVLEGEIGVPGSRAFTFQSGSPLVFEDFDGDGVEDLAVESTATLRSRASVPTRAMMG